MKLEDKIENIFRLTPAKKSALRKLGITTAHDMLYYFPFRYIEFAGLKKISELVIGEHASVIGEVVKIEAEKTWKKKMMIAQGALKDDTGSVSMVWFNQPYLANILKAGAKIMISGKSSYRKGKLFFANPEWQILTNNQPAFAEATAGRQPTT